MFSRTYLDIYMDLPSTFKQLMTSFN